MLLDFNEFDKPIFTWGDTATHPVMFATNADGYGHLSFWSIDQRMLETTGMQGLALALSDTNDDRGEDPDDAEAETSVRIFQSS